MSLKNYFAIAERVNSVSGLTGQEIGGEVESVGYHEQDIIFEQRMMPRVDFSKPENFARYGLASEYYDGAIKRIYGSFPYDGSRQERLEWENESLDIDLYIYQNLYPRRNGYIIFSAEGWGTGNMADGYGSSSTNEYIHFYGGPHANETGFTPYAAKFTGSNYYEPSKNRESNLKYDIADKGVSVEFWLKKKSFLPSLTRKEVIFDLWNGRLSSSADYGRLRIQLTGATSGLSPFRVTLLSGSTGVYDLSVGATTFSSASVADDKWHHYGFTFKSASAGLQTRFYVDGELNNELITGSGFQEVTGALQAYIGALIAPPSASTALAGYGKMSASLDEFRYWKTQRTSKGIGRYWFTQVGGGTNNDPEPFVDTVGDVNTLLGVYFKFNEGITGRTGVDSTVLDYSGRITNGAWTGYTPSSRNTGSAIVISAAAIKEYKDPIIYNFHPAVVALASSLEISGSDYDGGNAANIYNSIPQWIREDDEEGQSNTRYLTQIMASYFDEFQIKAQALTDIKSVEYPSGSQKPLPFAARLLNSHGFVAPDIFLDADILEKLADRSEFRVYEKTLSDIKNTIYQNIYNNLTYIYKTKGTEKSFRNLIRCFGIDDELIKINLYANDVEAEMRSNRKNVAVPDKFVNFNTNQNSYGTVVQYQDPSDTLNTAGYISGSGNLRNGYAFTMEAEVLFPQKLPVTSPGYEDTNIISASLFGVHGNAGVDEATPRWPGYTGNEDVVNFQVYAVRDEIESDNVRFMLTGTSGLTTVVPRLSSVLFEDVYADMNWNLAVRVRPESYPYTNVAGITPTNYVVELHGINIDAGVILNEFTVTGALASPGAGREYAFVTGSRRAFAGAHRTNFTGSVRTTSDVKLNSCRYWLTYLDDATLKAHGHDTTNAGTLNPHFYAFPFNSSASFGEIVDFDTLVFNWEFSNNTSSNALGQFSVADESSGSNAVASATNGWLGTLLNQQYSARGFDFTPSSTTVLDKDYVIAARQTLPENIYSTDMVKVFSQAEQDVFQIDSRPINYYFAFEKSLYQSISEEILNYFATLKDLNTLIGAPVNRYRQEYKGLKFLREKFFATVGNEIIDFDKFYEFYKWFDSSLTVMLEQLVPASTDFAPNVRTMIESHVLERSKYQSKFPFLESKGSPLVGSTSGTGNSAPAMVSQQYAASAPMNSNAAYSQRQVGASNVVPTKAWSIMHAPTSGEQDENSYWWQMMASRTENPTLTSSNAANNNVRQELLGVVRAQYRRQSNSPVRFGSQGGVTLGGVNFHPNKHPTFVMDATAPAGELVPGTNLPVNIMLSFQEDVEQLITTKDVYHPGHKQRLGFGINPDINRTAPGGANKSSTKNRMDGNVLAPFSLYSSSVKTGFNKEVISMYHSGVTITNLHHDIVHTNDVPMQGPFTEKYVGGWQYRHQDLNAYKASNPGTNYLDDRETRAEGWMLKLGLCDAAVSLGSGALGIVGPQYPDPSSVSGSAPKGYLFDRPKANLMRDEVAKRPVNIRNIKMTTGSTIIGNYEHNYQVVQTTGRELNDPYFNDQSFNFAPYPETLATRGRFPLIIATSSVAINNTYTDKGPWNTQKMRLDSDGGYLDTPGWGVSNNNSFAAPDSTGYGQHTCVSTWVSMSAANFDVTKAGGGTRYLWTLGRDGQIVNTLALVNGYGGVGTTPYHLRYVSNGWDVTDTEWYSDAPLNNSKYHRPGHGGWYHIVMYAGNDPAEPIRMSINGVSASYLPVSSTLPAGTLSDVNTNSAIGVYVLNSNGWPVAGSYLSSSAFGDVASYYPPSGFGDDSWAEFVSKLYSTASYGTSTITSSSGPVTTITTTTFTGSAGVVDLTASDAPANLRSWWKFGNGAGDTVASVTDYGPVGGNLATTEQAPYNRATQLAITTAGLRYVEGGYIQTSSVKTVTNALVTANPGGVLNYLLPSRTGSNSQHTVFVNRFAGSGYEVMSLGYMDPAHEALSVYNALPYHNLSIRNYGISGSASTDTSVFGKTITVRDQINKLRGLDQRATLHCGPFGSDAAYGSVPASTYVTTPSWHKTNRNRRRAIETLESRAGSFDGTDTKIDIGTDILWNSHIGGAGGLAKAFTLSAWVYPKTAGESSVGTIFSFGGPDRQLLCDAMHGAGFQASVGGSVTSGIVRSTVLSAFNKWYHVVMTYTGGNTGTLTLYVNGVKDHSVLDDQPEAPNIISGVDCVIGNYFGQTRTFDGYIQNCGVWNRGLTSKEVVSLYNGGKVAPLDIADSTTLYSPAGASLTAGLIGYYRLSSEAGDTTSTIPNRAPEAPPAGTTGTGTDLTLVGAGVGPSTYAPKSIYDNLYVQHQIPQSTKQYSWVAAAMAPGSTIFGLESPSCTTANSLTQLVSGASYVHSGVSFETSFTALNLVVRDPLNTSTHVAGTSSIQRLVNISYPQGTNALNLARNGAYGYPTWKQIRVGQSPMARALRKANRIGVVLPPPPVPKVSSVYKGTHLVSTTVVGYEPGIGFGPFVDYTERPVASHARPIYFTFQDNTANSNPVNNIAVKVSYANILDYFTNEGLNNRLDLGKAVDDGHAYNTVAKFTVDSGLSVVANYGQRVYPAAINAYSNAVRSRTEFSIKNIWNDLRSIRSSEGGLTGSMGFATSSQSIWPGDGHNNYTTIPSIVGTNDGAGELLANYTRYVKNAVDEYNSTDNTRTFGPVYSMPISLGSASAAASLPADDCVVAGDAKFVAAIQSGRVPYYESTTYNERMRLAAKDYSIIPEFRVSELIPFYIDQKQGNFLAQTDNMLSLTGAAISNSSDPNFYRVYSNADFLKYFSVVDNDLHEQRSGDLTITRDKLSLSCKAFLKLLPYKGFFPIERGAELASLFSASMSPSTDIADGMTAPKKAIRRIPMEMTYAPGILFNTIKSGVGVSHFCLVNNKEPKLAPSLKPVNKDYSASPGMAYTYLPEGFLTDIRDAAIVGAAASVWNNGYVINKVPFETIYRPQGFFNARNLGSLSGTLSDGHAWLYDTAPSQSNRPGITSFVQNSITIASPGAGQSCADLQNFRVDKTYTLAIDNFLCAAQDIFVDKFSSFISAREDNFGEATSGSVYTMTVKMNRTAEEQIGAASPSSLPDRAAFDMYRRQSAFGAPIAGSPPGVTSLQTVSYMHVTPPYFDGPAYAKLVFTASYDGRPALSDILSALKISYLRDAGSGSQTYVTASGGDNTKFGSPSPGIMHLDSTYNFTEALPEVVSGTTEQKFRWMIQSKFETPILNVQSASVPGGWSPAPPTSLITSGAAWPNETDASTLKTSGLWHQYAKVPTQAKEGVFISIEDQQAFKSPEAAPRAVAGKTPNSLARLVGFDSGVDKRVGAIKTEFRWEEAVVAVPFEIVENQRKFISLIKHRDSQSYHNLSRAMSKYNFPPRLDFTKFDTVDPILMYVFEFSAAMSQQDLADIWQNLLPDIGSKFETSTVIVEEKELLDVLLESHRDVHWMVFKVKKRVGMDFERLRRAQQTSNTASLPTYIHEPYSYNWPYDYCSLVELAQIEESVQWASRDLNIEEPVVIEYEPPTPDTPPAPDAAPAPLTITGMVANIVPPLEVPPQLDLQAPGEVSTPPTFNVQKAKPPRRKTTTKRRIGKGKKR